MIDDDKKAALLKLFREVTRPAPPDDGRPGNGISINIHTGDGDEQRFIQSFCTRL